MIEPTPENNAGADPQQVEENSVEAESYAAGCAELQSQVHEGWRIMNLRRAGS